MKSTEINFHTIINGIKHGWKAILAGMVLFSILGAICGGLYAKRNAADNAGQAQPLTKLMQGPNMSDFNAFYTFQSELEQLVQNINNYYSVLIDSEFLTEQENEVLQQKMEKLEDIDTELVVSAKTDLNRYGAIYVPEEFLEQQRSLYQDQLADTDSSLLSANEAKETIRMMDAPTMESEDITALYTSLLSQAANYGPLLEKKAELEYCLERMDTQKEEIINQCRELRAKQREAASALNQQVDLIQEMAQAHAQTNHVEFTVSYDNDNVATVTMTHTHRAVTVQETFLIILIFCALSGLCLGACYAICMEAGACKRLQKKKQNNG